MSNFAINRPNVYWSDSSSSSTIRARDLNCGGNVHHPIHVTCHVSHVTCHMSRVTSQLFSSDKVLKVVCGGSVINKATLTSVFVVPVHMCHELVLVHRFDNSQQRYS